jgi:hypothetical protein
MRGTISAVLAKTEPAKGGGKPDDKETVTTATPDQAPNAAAGGFNRGLGKLLGRK